MSDEPNVITYKSDTASGDMVYLAYVVLPNGEYWNVRFNGATEEIARSKAIALWNRENEKWNRLGLVPGGIDLLADNACDDAKTVANATVNDPWTGEPVGRGKHFIGKVWMRHETEGLKRVALTEIGLYEKNGYYRSGPRAK